MLGDGKVIEIGTPQDLLSTSTDSAFRRLVRLGIYRGENGKGRFELYKYLPPPLLSIRFVWGLPLVLQECRT